MSKNNVDFFKEKKEWSKTKDRILGSYLVPYFSKVMARGRPICYVDCFSGKGKFDDGSDGSPLIALKCLDSVTSKSRYDTKVFTYFIELNHGNDLESNIEDYLRRLESDVLRINCRVIKGSFEENIDSVLCLHKGSTVFLYVDPYGIKALDVDKFNSFKFDEKKSVEMLINFNTWGFFREACRVLNVNFNLDKEIEEFLVEYSPNNNLDCNELTSIAGGDFWIDIVKRYKNKKLSARDAEFELSKKIAQAFRKKYKFVLNVPIKSNFETEVPKYRLFYLTNHTDGCILMAENMYNQIEDASIKSRNGQLSLFDNDTEGMVQTDDKLKSMLIEILPTDFTRIDDFICNFLTREGLITSPKKIRNLLKELENNNIIMVDRFPKTTSKGKVSSFMSEDKDKKVLIKRKQCNL